MKITIIQTNETGPPTRLVIADNYDKGIEVYHERPESTFELLELLRATEATPVDRGNARTVVTFTVEYSLSTVVEAEIELHDIRERTPTLGRVVFESYSATQRLIRYMDPAAIQITDLSYYGCCVNVSYQIIGGLMKS